MSDCDHPLIKCHKCHRYLDEPKLILPSNGNQYPPAVAEIGGADEGFHISKGPLSIEVNFTDEGVVVDVWDSTEEAAADPIVSCYEFYASCEDPWKHQTDPNQQELEL